MYCVPCVVVWMLYSVVEIVVMSGDVCEDGPAVCSVVCREGRTL